MMIIMIITVTVIECLSIFYNCNPFFICTTDIRFNTRRKGYAAIIHQEGNLCYRIVDVGQL